MTDAAAPRRWQARVPPGTAPGRLDRWLAGQGLGLGRRALAELFARGAVTLDGHRVPKAARVEAGALVELDLPPPRRAMPDPSAPLRVVYEDERQLVVVKPAGQPCVAITGEDLGTLAGALLARYPEQAVVGSPLEAGLVHRLDNGTSGLCWVARSEASLVLARRLLGEGRLGKRYLALVSDGDTLPERGEVEAWIAPSRDPARVQVVPEGHPGGRAAVTRFVVLARRRGVALVEASAPRALRHQVRVHLAYVGHPLLNDHRYGGHPVEALGSRHALHASRIVSPGAEGLRPLDVSSELPSELSALLDA